jgi:hypothetical protein
MKSNADMLAGLQNVVARVGAGIKTPDEWAAVCATLENARKYAKKTLSLLSMLDERTAAAKPAAPIAMPTQHEHRQGGAK